jgi:thiol-disulfide isomerase/thioredoxin
MRTNSFLLAAGALALAFSSSVLAQDAPLHASQSAPQTVSNASPQPSSASHSVQGVPRDNLVIIDPAPAASLGDVARLAREKKSSQPKSVKIFDDENMPRAPLSTGQKAPGFVSSSGGKLTLLDFWATWCGPCRQALPGLKQFQAAYGPNQVEVISISEDEDESAWQSFVAQNQMTWTQRLDSDHQMMRQYGASSLPTYVLIGKDGNVVQQYVGHDPGEPILERMGPELRTALQ